MPVPEGNDGVVSGSGAQRGPNPARSSQERPPRDEGLRDKGVGKWLLDKKGRHGRATPGPGIRTTVTAAPDAAHSHSLSLGNESLMNFCRH